MIIHFWGNETLLELSHVELLLEGIQERINKLNNRINHTIIEDLSEEMVLSDHLATISQKIADLQNDIKAITLPLEKKGVDSPKNRKLKVS
ncbi:MAG: hypothetical protein JWN56_1218 [Sphingobacteriales bacterium]|nr:hypothetical protein [Sphingobacteriales bacterium]